MPQYILGARAHDYGCDRPDKLFKQMRNDGFCCTQLALLKAIPDLESYRDITPDIVREVGQALSATGMQAPVMGVYVDPSLVDEERRRAQVEMFISQIPICKELGISCMGTETTAMGKQPTGTTKQEAQKQLLASLEEILPVAEQHGVVVALEPVWHHALDTPETTKMVLDAMASPNLKLLFDPANLLAKEWIGRQDTLFGRAMELWGEKIMAVHFKGVCYDRHGVRTPCALEQSVVDYQAAFRVMESLPQQILPVLREEAVPARAAEDIAFILSKLQK